MNRCSMCGRFRSWSDLTEWEHISLTLYGDLIQNWGYECKPGYGCRIDQPNQPSSQLS